MAALIGKGLAALFWCVVIAVAIVGVFWLALYFYFYAFVDSIEYGEDR